MTPKGSISAGRSTDGAYCVARPGGQKAPPGSSHTFATHIHRGQRSNLDRAPYNRGVFLSRVRWVARALICFLFVLAPTRGAIAQSAPAAAGYAKIVAGTATVVRGGLGQRLNAGDAIFQGDILQTGADGHIGVTLRDDTRLALGPETQLTVTTFEFAPAEERLGLVLRLARGVLDYVSGRIAKLAPGAIRIETPSSVVGVRGTHLLLGANQR